MNSSKNLALAGLATAGALAMGSASAAAIDVTAVTTAISETLTPIGAVGLGVLAVLVAIKTYKWVRRAM
jgi:uncharacterized membrane protein